MGCVVLTLMVLWGIICPMFVSGPVSAHEFSHASETAVRGDAALSVGSGAVPAEQRARIEAAFYNLPLYFIENRGQVDAQVAYYVQGSEAAVYFAPAGLTFALSSPAGRAASLAEKVQGPWERAFRHRVPLSDQAGARAEAVRRWAVRLDFVGANPDVRPVGEKQTEAVVSYFKGRPEEWRVGLPTYSQVAYYELWPGIDLVYVGRANELKYEFRVKPGGDPSRIRLAYRGAERVSLTAAGALQVETAVGSFSDAAPVAYQEVEGRQVAVEAAFSLEGEEYGFRLGAYDPAYPLVIDPVVLLYCGYIGGAGWDDGFDVAVDGAGNAYVTGMTGSSEDTFPVAVGPHPTHNGAGDAFVAKVRADGTGLVYCGYIGGDGDDSGVGIAVDGAGNAYVMGETGSSQSTFPVVVGPDLTYNGDIFDAFVAKVGAASPPKLRLLFVPLRWQGTQNAFEAEVRAQVNFFLDEVPLNACRDRVLVRTLDVATQNFAGFTCSARDCAVGSIRSFVREQLHIEPAHYDIIVGLAETTPCSPLGGCSNGTDTIWVTSEEDSIVAHEVGHIYGLEDQYCSNQAGSTDDRCNDGDVQGDGAATGDVNWLDASAPCDCPPDGSNDSGGSPCCNFDANHSCASVGYGVCCYGNKNSSGGRSIMSYANAPGPRRFDTHSIAHLSTIPQLNCGASDSEESAFTTGSTADGFEPIVDVNLFIYCSFAKVGVLYLENGCKDVDLTSYR